jgi:hypothetical protein
MCVTFYDNQGIIHNEFVRPCQTVNKKHYVDVLFRLVQLRVKPEFHVRGSWLLLFDKVRPHTTFATKQFLKKRFQN